MHSEPMITTAKLVEAIIDSVNAETGMRIIVHQKPKGEDGKAQVAELLAIVKQQSFKVGMIGKETEEGNLMAHATRMLKADGLTTVDVSSGIANAMCVKDDAEQRVMNKAAELTSKAMSWLVEYVEEIVNDNQRVSHAKLSEQCEDKILEPEKLGIRDMDADDVDICYPPIIQSGGEYELKMSAQSSEKKLHYSVVHLSVGARHMQYCANVGRTMMIDPSKQMEAVYAAAVAAQVNPALQDYEFERIERDRPTNLNAWELYLKALHTFNERTHADHKDLGVAHAKQMCEQVISLDKKMSHAYSLMADIYFAELGQFLTDDSATPLQKIYDYAKVASDLDPKNSVAANLIASHFFFSGKFDQSKLYAERAVKLNPSFPEALYRLGQSLVHSGQYADAEEYYHKAIALSPLDPNSNVYKNGLFFANLGQNNFEAALSYNDECRLQFPTVGTYKGFNAATLGHLERGDEAKLALEEYLVLRPNLKKKSDYKRIFVPNASHGKHRSYECL